MSAEPQTETSLAYEQGRHEARQCRLYGWQVTCPYDMRTKEGRAFMSGYRQQAAALEAGAEEK